MQNNNNNNNNNSNNIDKNIILNSIQISLSRKLFFNLVMFSLYSYLLTPNQQLILINCNELYSNLSSSQ